MGVLCFVYLICALRTNVAFVGIFLFITPAFGCLAGAYWHLATLTPAGAATAGKLLKAAGAFSFVVCFFGWWIFAAIMLAGLDFPFQIPGMFACILYQADTNCGAVGDLSRLIKGASDKAKHKEERYQA